MPWADPTTGIRWAAHVPNLNEARALLEQDPSLAGNKARKTMDIELALIAENLKIRLPFRFREKNDHRMAHEFLEQIAKDAKKCFEIKGSDGKYKLYVEAGDKLATADRYLVSWANRASHAEITKAEAAKVIDSFEEVLNLFVCDECKVLITKKHDEKGERLQCECGKFRWQYSKA